MFLFQYYPFVPGTGPEGNGRYACHWCKNNCERPRHKIKDGLRGQPVPGRLIKRLHFSRHQAALPAVRQPRLQEEKAAVY